MAKEGKGKKAGRDRLRLELMELREAMHVLSLTNPDSTAIAFYFMALREDLERVKGMCRKRR